VSRLALASQLLRPVVALVEQHRRSGATAIAAQLSRFGGEHSLEGYDVTKRCVIAARVAVIENGECHVLYSGHRYCGQCYSEGLSNTLRRRRVRATAKGAQYDTVVSIGRNDAQNELYFAPQSLLILAV